MEVETKTLNQFEKLLDRLETRSFEEVSEEIENPLLLIYLNKHRYQLYRYWWAIENALRRCDSPIEQMLLLGLVNLFCDSEVTGLEFIDSDDRWDRFEISSAVDIVIYPQANVGKYRVDFRVKLIEYKGLYPQYGQDKHYIKELIIECDGHEFHEKTKQQVQKDKKRDRDLTAMGFHVLRFTGSEIWKDPFLCAREIHNQLVRSKKTA